MSLPNPSGDPFAIGPGDVTAGMAKRTVKDVAIHVVNDLESVASVADALVQ